MTDPTFGAESAAIPRPGWYPDPAGSPALRWWSGVAWTDDLHPAPSTQPYATQQYPGQPGAMPAFGSFGKQPYSRPTRSPSSGRWVIVAAAAGLAVLTVAAVAVALGGHRSPTPQSDLAQPPAAAVPAPYGTPGVPICPPATATSFQTTPRPPAGFEGRADIFRATGTGTWDSPEFVLGGGQVGGNMAQCGDGAYFYLVPSGSAFDEGATPTASCNSGCAEGGWGSYDQNPASGRYRLHVVASSATSWTFALTENVSLPLSMKVTGTKITGTSVDAHGLANQDSSPFTFYLRPRAGGASHQIVGGFSCQLACTLYLVPVGRSLDPARDLVHASGGGESGGMVATIRASGGYRLVVRTTSYWTFALQQ